MKKIIAVVLALMMLLSLLAGCKSGKTENEAAGITFTVVHADESKKTFTLDPEQETLASALAAAGVISQQEAEAGFATEVDGELADYNADQAWWKLTDKSGADSQVGILEIKTADADGYTFTYTIG